MARCTFAAAWTSRGLCAARLSLNLDRMRSFVFSARIIERPMLLLLFERMPLLSGDGPALSPRPGKISFEGDRFLIEPVSEEASGDSPEF